MKYLKTYSNKKQISNGSIFALTTRFIGCQHILKLVFSCPKYVTQLGNKIRNLNVTFIIPVAIWSLASSWRVSRLQVPLYRLQCFVSKRDEGCLDNAQVSLATPQVDGRSGDRYYHTDYSVLFQRVSRIALITNPQVQ